MTGHIDAHTALDDLCAAKDQLVHLLYRLIPVPDPHMHDAALVLESAIAALSLVELHLDNAGA